MQHDLRSTRSRRGVHRRPGERRDVALSVIGATMACSLIAVTLAVTSPSSAAERPENLVVNGAFEEGQRGWRTHAQQEHQFAIFRRPLERSLAARLTTSKPGNVVMTDRRSTVRDTRAGRSYLVTASLRAPRGAVRGTLRLRELQAGSVRAVGKQSFALKDAKWHRVRLRYKARESGGRIDVDVIARDLRRSDALLVDKVRLVARPGPSSTPSESAPAGGPSTGCALNPSARGLPTCGALLGAAVGGNTDPASRESQVGGVLGIRRTYFRGDQVTGAVTTAKNDLAKGRLPWISFKLPYSWTDMANGVGDAWATDLATRLAALDGPVWVAFHHEPEGDGDLEEWKRMQRHLSPLIRSRASNVAFTVIYMGWHEFFGSTPEYKMNAIWPGDGVVDVVGYDIYNNYGVVKDGVTVTKMTELRDYYVKIAPWAKAHGVSWAVGETGYTDGAAEKDPQWLNRAYDDLVAYGGSALAYFDSELNSAGSWAIDTQPKVAAFRRSLAGSSKLR